MKFLCASGLLLGALWWAHQESSMSSSSFVSAPDVLAPPSLKVLPAPSFAPQEALFPLRTVAKEPTLSRSISTEANEHQGAKKDLLQPSRSQAFVQRQNPYIRMAQTTIQRARQESDYIKALMWASAYQVDQKTNRSASETVKKFNDRYAQRIIRLSLTRIGRKDLKQALQKELQSSCPWCSPSFHSDIPIVRLTVEDVREIDRFSSFSLASSFQPTDVLSFLRISLYGSSTPSTRDQAK